jgi:trehalose 6-phosphate synthase/phosphatase
MSKTIIVSNRLPISITRENNQLHYKPSAGGLATGLGSVYKNGDNLWLGWPGVYLDDPEERAEVILSLSDQKMSPVFLSEEEIELCYEGFCNESLWPAFHYFTQYIAYESIFWDAYKAVNEKFCQAILKKAGPEDTIWIHDYQLLLLPGMLREYLPNASIAFFQHIPFPSYEIMRMIPWRKQLLEGMVGADLIGFHTYDDMRHFLSAVGRLLGLKTESGYIETDERLVNVDAFPMGIDYEKYEKNALKKSVDDHISKFQTSLIGQKLLLTIDRLDYSKGIPGRIKAFDLFLSQNPNYLEKVSMIMIVVPSRDTVKEYKRLKEEVDELVGKVNGQHGTLNWTPVYYFYRSFSLGELSAFYKMSEIALITPLRDGMNLVCKEYIASKTDGTGVLILSEMAGAAKELTDSILVNPNDSDQMVQAIHTALEMPIEEQKLRITSMQVSLKRYNIFQWVKVFMGRLTTVKEKQKEFTSKVLDQTVLQGIAQKYKGTKERLIFLDYDGTLMPFFKEPHMASPDQEVLQLLKGLSDQKQNRLIVISGRDKDTLEEWLGHLPIELVAEHGAWIKESKNGEKGDWEVSGDLDDRWKEEIRDTMEYYVNRTPGAFIEEKNYSLVWHYRKVESGLGELRMQELLSHLKYMARGKNLQVLEGHMVLEIKNPGINKGLAALKFARQKSYDFIFAAGDDWTDEDLFKALPDDAYTCRVGTSYTHARFSVKSHLDIRGILKALKTEV